MQLKQLKLSGFKSFVEPTMIPFPGPLVAVVGPNGCGKSNLIDAVRWVMGESSAKHLRGESMVDVIFNGSSQRKPVGQASVELIFDNTLGRLSGPYTNYQEIAIKRVVTRDGESNYYLNSTRCRRKDIAEIFLGTGAGMRGYAIIGQDMITRIIEAKPDELRVYLEEAAGVSKYKDRRRETLQRMEHTRENLERSNDILEELNQQLVRLEAQAKAAERFKSLKAKERQLKSDVLCLKYQALMQEKSAAQTILNTIQSSQEKEQINLSALEQQIMMLRHRYNECKDKQVEAEAQFYQLNSEIARLEERVKQAQQLQSQRLENQKRLMVEEKELAAQLNEDEKNTQQCQQALQQLEKTLADAKNAYTQQQEALKQLQQAQQAWNLNWQKNQTACNQISRESERHHLRIQHLAQQKQNFYVRVETLQTQRHQLELEPLHAEINRLEQVMVQTQAEVVDVEQACHRMSIASRALREKIPNLEAHIQQAQKQWQTLTVHLAALQAAQESALSHAQLSKTSLSTQNATRLVDQLNVEKKWLQACEWILGDGLQALILNGVDLLQQPFMALKDQPNIFVSAQEMTVTPSQYPRLVEKIKGPIPQWIFPLASIIVAEDLEQALSWWPNLASNESILTPNGYWFGQGWVKIADFSKDATEGVLQRKQAILETQEAIATAQQTLTTYEHSYQQTQTQLQQANHNEAEKKQQLTLMKDELRQHQSNITVKQQLLNQALSQQQRFDDELDSLHAQIETCVAEESIAQTELNQIQQHYQQIQAEQAQLIQAKSSWENSLPMISETVDQWRVSIHQQEIEYEKIRLQQTQGLERIDTGKQKLSKLQAQLQQLNAQLEDLNERESLEKKLAEKIKLHSDSETQVSQYRCGVEETNQQLQHLESQQKHIHKQIKQFEEQSHQQALHIQAFDIRAQTFIDALSEMGVTIEPQPSEDVSENSLALKEQALKDITNQINRLGAVNLIAIETYQNESQRKRQLESHHHDLIEALTTLESAISKMDQETQKRLLTTFNEVNTNFQALFPKLFGGGHAKLTLNCDNLLEAGISVIAQPPGKRNSTIHMLSGGEKAMTAVALIFAIFQLNPAPFCMLDEVDAPLDEANVGRFCALVKEMSEAVQFLFITHNKTTMELADHLIGVTMREPGVSRIVTVDVGQALSMSEHTSGQMQ